MWEENENKFLISLNSRSVSAGLSVYRSLLWVFLLGVMFAEQPLPVFADSVPTRSEWRKLYNPKFDPSSVLVPSGRMPG